MPKCPKLEVPKPPDIDLSKLGDGVNMPKGMSLNDLKEKAQNPGLGDKLKNAGAAIGENIKNTIDQFNPAAIADRVAGAVTGMVGDIKNGIEHAADGLNSLKNKITGFDPGSMVPNVDSPAGFFKDMKNKAKDKLSRIGDGLSDQLNCNKAGLNAAGKASGQAQSEGAAALDGLSNKQRIDMARSSETKQEKINETTNTAKKNVEKKLIDDVKKPVRTETVQDVLQSDSLPERLGVDIGDCTKTMKEIVMSQSITMMVQSISDIIRGRQVSFGFKYNLEESLQDGYSPSNEAAKLISAIKQAGNNRALGGVAKGMPIAWQAFCEELPTLEGIIDEKRNMTYKEYIQTGWPYFFKADSTITGQYWKDVVTYPGHFNVQKQTLEKMLFRMYNAPDEFYNDIYGENSDISKYTTYYIQPIESPKDGLILPGGFWIHHTITANQGPKGYYLSVDLDMANRKPMDNFRERFQHEETLEKFKYYNTMSKKSLVANFQRNEVTDLINDNVDNPGFFVHEVIVPYSKQHRQVFPPSLLVATHFNMDTYTIDKVENLGPDEILTATIT